MKEVVFEVIISVIILALLIVVINLFRGNMDIIGATANKTDNMEKVGTESFTAVGKDIKVVRGSDVVAAIRYYANDTSVKIYFNGAECANGAVPVELDDYESLYSVTSKYEGTKLIEIRYSTGVTATPTTAPVSN